MNNSLLPPNASELDRHIEQLVIHSTDLPVRIADLWDPLTCPLPLLPWLAWALSVDKWDDRWPEHVKRQVVQNSFDVHRYKGTPHAVQMALDSLNIKSYLREWWEPDGSQEPGTMTAVALINENLTGSDDGLLTKEMLKQVTQAINTAKRGVIHFNVELGLYFEESLGLSGGIGPSIDIKDSPVDFIPVVPDAMHGGVGLSGGIGTSIGSIDYSTDFIPVVPDAMRGGVGLSGGIGTSVGSMDHSADFIPITPEAMTGGIGLSGGIGTSINSVEHIADFLSVVPDLVLSNFQLAVVSHQLCLFDICFEGIG